MPKKKKHKAVDIQKAIALIGDDTIIPDRLQRYRHWGEQYLSGKKRPAKKMVDKLLLDFARDFKIWVIQKAMEAGDIPALASLASEILDRYEDRPKVSLDFESDGKGIGGIVLLPPQTHMGIKDGEAGNNLETTPRPTDRVSE